MRLAWFCPVLVALALAAEARIVGDYSIWYKGKTYVHIDNAGVFFYPADQYPHPMPVPEYTAATIRSLYGFDGITECRLVDWVDCSGESHDFRDDGKSRVMEILGEKYRVTDWGREVSWYSYTVTLPGVVPGEPYLLVAQLPDDRERYTTISVSVAEGEKFAKPFTGQEEHTMEQCQQPEGFRPDVGGGQYTGREIPVKNRPYNYCFLFYPKAERMTVTVSHIGCEADRKNEGNGAAVARIWVFKVVTPLSERAVEVDLPLAEQRRVGLYVTHPWYLLAHYGYPAHTEEQRRGSLENMAEYMRFCGFNYLEWNAVNGSDRASRAWYASRYVPMLGADLLAELCAVTDVAGIWNLPVVSVLRAPKEEGQGDWTDEPNRFGFSRESFLYQYDGTPTKGFGDLVPDPLRPETQALLLGYFEEIGRRVRGHPSVIGMGFRVNGKHGLCWPEECIWDAEANKGYYYNAWESGYSDWDISLFERETGRKVPGRQAEAYEWLRENCWEEWLAWRCRKMAELWLAARDLVWRYNRDWVLVAKTDLPSETPGTNIKWAGEGLSVLDLLIPQGYDPRLYRDERGIVVSRVMMIGADRFFGAWGGPWGSHAEGYKLFHFQPGLQELYRTPDGNEVEVYFNYWEEGTPEHPHPEYEFGTWLRTATVTPKGRWYFEAPAHALVDGNVTTLAFLGWERASIGREAELRRWCRAFRSLPAVEPAPFEGKVLPEGDGTIWVRWFKDRLAVVNNSGEHKWVTVELPAGEGVYYVDLSTGARPEQSVEGELCRVRLPMEEFDLRVLKAYRPAPVTGELPPPPPE